MVSKSELISLLMMASPHFLRKLGNSVMVWPVIQMSYIFIIYGYRQN